MIYVVAALPWEARPIVERHKLKRDDGCKFFPLFKGNGMYLIVSGIGKMASAIATTYLLAGVNTDQGVAIVNIGVCGAASQKHSIGTPVLIHRIVDYETGREYYPDILLEHPFVEGSIATHNRLVRQKDVDSGQIQLCADFVDMEASGFFQAASKFLSPHQIYIIKIIGDYLEADNFDKSEIVGLITEAMDKIDGFLEQIEIYCKPNEPIFSDDELGQLEDIKKRLRLTVTQGHQLVELARRYKLRAGKPLPDLSDIVVEEVKIKAEGRKAFERIKRILTDE
ncbi:MAG: hypothetical protein GX094_05230 [Clostridiales bacterium]|nr:hypothetical protein [Clostridiales bacterium]